MASVTSENSAPGEDKSTWRDFIYILTAAAGGAAAVAWPLIDQMNPAAETLSLSSVECDFAKVALGQQVVILWRKPPLFIRHRTPAEIVAAVADDHAPMRDPATDESRHKPGMAEWLIVIGVCTHLGCTPTFGEGQVSRLVLSLPRVGLRHFGPHSRRTSAQEPPPSAL